MKYTWPTLMIVAAPSSGAWYHAAEQYGLDVADVNSYAGHWTIVSTTEDFPGVASQPSNTPWLQLPNVSSLLVNAMRNRFGPPKSFHDIVVVDASDSKGWHRDKLRQVDG